MNLHAWSDCPGVSLTFRPNRAPAVPRLHAGASTLRTDHVERLRKLRRLCGDVQAPAPWVISRLRRRFLEDYELTMALNVKARFPGAMPRCSQASRGDQTARRYHAWRAEPDRYWPYPSAKGGHSDRAARFQRATRIRIDSTPVLRAKRQGDRPVQAASRCLHEGNLIRMIETGNWSIPCRVALSVRSDPRFR
jgi:hypothetical protein